VELERNHYQASLGTLPRLPVGDNPSGVPVQRLTRGGERWPFGTEKGNPKSSLQQEFLPSLPHAAEEFGSPLTSQAGDRYRSRKTIFQLSNAFDLFKFDA
jgi:hypothetical protein